MKQRADTKFEVDTSRMVVRVGVRPAFALETARVWAEISVIEFQDHAANLTLGVNQCLRELAAQVRPTAPVKA